MQSSQRERYVDVAWDSRPIITAGLKIQFLAHQSAPNPARLEREFIRTQQQHRHRAILQPLAPPPWDQGIVTSYCWKPRPLGINPLPIVVRYPPGVAARDHKAASVDWAVPITPAPRELCEHWRLPNSIHSRNYNVMN